MKVPHPLPPGQRERSDFPRFGLTHFAKRFPKQSSTIEVAVGGDVEQQLVLAQGAIPWGVIQR